MEIGVVENHSAYSKFCTKKAQPVREKHDFWDLYLYLVIGNQGVAECYVGKGQPLPVDGLDVDSNVSTFQSMGYLMGHPGSMER